MPSKIRLDFELFIINIIDKYGDSENLIEIKDEMINCVNKIYMEFIRYIYF